MLRFLARVWAKRKYIWTLETEAAANELNAGLSAKRAAEKRVLVAELKAEAEAIEKQIAEGQESEEYKSLAG